MKMTKILIAVIFSTLFCSALFGQRSNKNAMYKVWVRTVEHEKVQGYLGAVGENTITVLNLSKSKKRTIALNEIKTIKLRKDGEVLEGAGHGLLVGTGIGVVGAAVGFRDVDPGYKLLSLIVGGIYGAIPATIFGGFYKSGKIKIPIDGDLARLRKDLIPYVVSWK